MLGQNSKKQYGTVWFFYLFVNYLAIQTMAVFPSRRMHERELLDVLTTNYNPSVLPSDKAIEVKFDLRLTKIVKLDIKEQQLQINARILMMWVDVNLQWNSSQHGAIDRLVVPAATFWTPDILLYNTASDESVSALDVYKANLQVDEEGRVTWMSPVTLKSSCDINVKWFPFDSQNCSLLFGSISMTRKRLQLKFYNKPKSIEGFQDKFHYSSGVWKVKALAPHLRDESYSCCKSPFSLIEFNLSLKRLPLYYVLYLVLPCLCLSLLSPFVFFVPPESGERIGFGITIVLAMSVYLLVISDKLPEKSNESPLIGVLYTELFFIMIATLLAAIYTTHIAYKTTKPPQKLRHILCNICGSKRTKPRKVTVGEKNEASKRINRQTEIKIEDAKKTNMQAMGGVYEELKVMFPCEQNEMTNEEQWKQIAKRIDHANFRIFFLLTVSMPFVTTLVFLR